MRFTSLLIIQGTTPLQDLQLLHTMLEFFSKQLQQSSPEAGTSQFADLSVLCTVFMFLFMEPSSGSKKGGSGNTSNNRKDRVDVMAKLVALAMGHKNK